MTSRHALLPAITAAVVLVLAIVLPFAGCGLPLQGLTSEPDGGSPCNADGQCDDMNPCTVDGCAGGTCSHASQPDGPAPSAKQVAFDCKVLQCTGGQPTMENDSKDIEVDSEDCTIDQCDMGQAFHTAKNDDTPCTMGGEGICKGGQCQIVCKIDAKCDDKNPCTQDSCDVAQGICSFAPLNGMNTPGGTQVDRDCNVQVCVDGVDTKSPDDSDLPVTPTDCDEELCDNGVPGNPPRALDVSCGAPSIKVCDGAGTCVECNSPAQCGIDSDCLKYTCTAGACAAVNVPVNTHVPAQTPGDCSAVACDGNGAVLPQPIVDDNDTKSDNNDCTTDGCTNGAISYVNLMPGDPCGNGQKCNASILCGCGTDAQCNSPATCGGGNPGTPFTCGCTKTNCGDLGATCGTLPDACGSTLNCNTGSKNGAETDIDCGGGGSCATLCGSGKACTAGTDCVSGNCADGVCCNNPCNGTCTACTAAKKGSGVDGICGSIPAYQPDNAPVCAAPAACDGANHCRKIDGQTCTLNNECVSGSCADGVCCGAACGGLCQACSAAKKGGGADGVCGPIALNQTDITAPFLCGGTNVCDGNGACKSSLGQPCSTSSTCANNNCVEGACCGVASCPACQSCLAGNGACGNLPSGLDSVGPNTCNGSSSCDGTGNCKKANGQGCATTAECATGTCVDSVCCGVASCPACKSCALGANGTCGNIAAGTQDLINPGMCSAPSTCDGAGGCKKVNGQACVQTSECATGTCIDLVCCGVASCPACQSCALGGGGTCGNIADGMLDTVSPNTCTGMNVCAGGACKAVQGQPCPGGQASNCQSGFCADNVCCNVKCDSTDTCMTCSGGTAGTCSMVTGADDTDSCPAATKTCDSAGACLLKAGQACILANPTACASGICTAGLVCQ